MSQKLSHTSFTIQHLSVNQSHFDTAYLESPSSQLIVALFLLTTIWSISHFLIKLQTKLKMARLLLRSARARINILERFLKRLDQGFFTFNFMGQIIPKRQSRSANLILNNTSERSSLFELLQQPEKDRLRLQKFLVHLKESRISLDDFSKFAPKKIKVGNRIIHLQFERDPQQPNEYLIAFFADKTDQIAAIEESQKQQDYVELVLNIVRDPSSFKLFLADARRLLNQLLEQHASGSSSQDCIRQIKYSLHTLKGAAGLAAFDSIAKEVHRIETILDKANLSDTNEVFDFFNELKKVISFIDIELEKVFDDFRDLLGTIPALQLNHVKRDLTSLSELFKNHKNLLQQMALRSGKAINVEISIEEIYVDANSINGLLSSLIHIFRNAIDHGIETANERALSGKNTTGVISISARLQDSPGTNQKCIELNISDDGRGIDIAKIRESSIKKWPEKAPELTKMNEADLLELIFKEDFSSLDKANLNSGRGIGLSVCRSEVKKLGGQITFLNRPNLGTNFCLSWPNTEKADPSADPSDVESSKVLSFQNQKSA
jgi:two-component system chemotaxis sensor kinase CheA